MGNAPRVVLSIAVGATIGLGALFAYLGARPLAPSTEAAPPEQADPPQEKPQEKPVDAPPETIQVPAPSAEPGTKVAKVIIEPASAGVLVDGKVIADHGGSIELEGEPGDKRTVVVTAGARSKVFVVELTAEGPQPSRLDLAQPQQAPPPPPPSGAPSSGPEIYD